MKKSGWVTLVLILLILVTAVLIVIRLAGRGADQTAAVRSNPQGSGAGPQAPGRPRDAGGNQGREGTTRITPVRISPVLLGTVENSVVISGDVLSASQVSIYPTMPGRLMEMRVKAGDTVRRGETLAVVDPSRPGDFFYGSPVVSTVSGSVLSVPVNVGETLELRTVVCVVGDLSQLRVETYVPERYSVYMRPGLPAQVSFEAMPGEVFPAEIDELSPALDPASRTRQIRLRFVSEGESPSSGTRRSGSGAGGGLDPRILSGMFATVSLVTNSHIDVPVIPRNALINTYGSWIVFVIPPETETARSREVTLGLESEDSVEITSGLEPGELVVVAGQNFLNDGDPVRIVE